MKLKFACAYHSRSGPESDEIREHEVNFIVRFANRHSRTNVMVEIAVSSASTVPR